MGPLLSGFLLALALGQDGREPEAPTECGEEASTGSDQEEEEEEENLPIGFEEHIVVTATRIEEPVEDSIAFVTVLPAREIAEAPTLVLDDALRWVPGFSLFRRSSSLVAHPTTQGVSLRGIGPSGTSRSLVLFDGIPLNDPFGGWVYWNRLPLSSLGRVEIARGAGSQLYGSSALGGTLQLFPTEPTERAIDVRARLGTHETYDVDASFTDSRGDWSYLLSGRLFDTDGYFIVDDDERGGVDRPARSEYQSLFGRLAYKGFHAGVNLFREERGNGTALQQNKSVIRMFETGYRDPRWQLGFYSQWQTFESTFSRILPDRSEEFLTAEQRFPALGLGASLTWQPRGRLMVGADWRRARWEDERQSFFGVFVQDQIGLHERVDLLLGIRADAWENRTHQASVNPRIGALFRVSPTVTVRGSAYRGFRAPTLNELYRPFRVGNVRTEANPDLAEEHLWGLEVGGDLHPSGDAVLRLNAYWSSLRDPVGNVTLSISPERVRRRRQNIGRVSIKGFELEGNVPLGDTWDLHGSYLYSDTMVEATGRRLPQVPRHRARVGVDFGGRPLRVGIEARWVGAQWEDDRNTLELDGFTVVHLSFRRRISRQAELFLGIENVFDEKYPVARVPIERLGTPRLLHAGIHLTLEP